MTNVIIRETSESTLKINKQYEINYHNNQKNRKQKLSRNK